MAYLPRRRPLLILSMFLVGTIIASDWVGVALSLGRGAGEQTVRGAARLACIMQFVVLEHGVQ